MDFFLANTSDDLTKYREMIVFKIQDIGAFRASMEIISNITCQNENIKVSFYQEGIIIDVCSSDQKLMSHWELYRAELLSYRYEVTDNHGNRLEPYTLSCKASDWHQAIKGESKKAFAATFSILINPENMRNRGINLYDDSGNLSAVTDIPTTHTMVNADAFTDYFKRCYDGENPCVKVHVELYCRKVIAKYQNLKCNTIKYVFVGEGRIKTIGQRDTQRMATVTIVDGGVDDEEDDNSHTEESYAIKLSLKNKNSDWMSKLPRLARDSILKIYLKPQAPLIIQTNIGHFGNCVFTFIDAVTQTGNYESNSETGNLIEWY